ncbi:MAG: NfeD family protein [Gammaproteobacteria bacterium]|nr:NfeD family protein [Gammaproteobacteria bacterium]
MPDIGLEPWHIWVVLGISLFACEIFTPGFVLVSLGIGAFAGAACHAIFADFGWAVAGFAVGASIALVGIRPALVRTFMDDTPSPFGTEGMKGNIVTIADASDIGGAMKTQFRGSLWNVDSEDDLLEGDQARIVDVEGTTLKVVRLPEE